MYRGPVSGVWAQQRRDALCPPGPVTPAEVWQRPVATEYESRFELKKPYII